jgi:S-adenosyl-L-methionine hydrolase (adenosine-forming)
MLGLVAMITDFGTSDGYVGMMKGVMLRNEPGLTLVDITHEIPSHDVRLAALTLLDVYSHFPYGTVFLVVVDPGVGGTRVPVALRLGGYTFVGPDNGVFSYVARRAGPDREVVALAVEPASNGRVSATFHGRDLFGPAAARLAATSASLEQMGSPYALRVWLPWPELRFEGDRIVGEITRIDRFGNLITSIGPLEYVSPDTLVLRDDTAGLAFLGPDAEFELLSHGWVGISRSYYETPRGQLAALVGSSGYLEIVMNQGSARDALGANIGDHVVVRIVPLSARRFAR